jgi:H+/Cl- antiporter ClcA
VSYDTLTALLRGEMALVGLAMLVAFKLIATSISIGVGIPGGLIGPTLLIGGAVGALMGQLVGTLGLREDGRGVVLRHGRHERYDGHYGCAPRWRRSSLFWR